MTEKVEGRRSGVAVGTVDAGRFGLNDVETLVQATIRVSRGEPFAMVAFLLQTAQSRDQEIGRESGKGRA